MVTKKTEAKESVGKLKLKKETVRDLDVRGKSARVKGGRRNTDNDCSVGCTGTCLVCPY